MLKLVKLLFSLACLAGFVWFGATADLGGRTLFGHLQAIGSSKESQELVRGTKQKVSGLLGQPPTDQAAPAGPVDKAGPASRKDTRKDGAGKTAPEKAGPAAGAPAGKGAPGKAAPTKAANPAAKAGSPPKTAGAPAVPTQPAQEHLTSADRDQMRKLLESTRGAGQK